MVSWKKKILNLSMHDAKNSNFFYKFVINKDKSCLTSRVVLTAAAFIV